MYRVLLACCLLSTLSCATALTGKHETISVSSSPAGANATLVCAGNPAGSGVTPAKIPIPRNAGDCVLTVEKEGFAPQTWTIEQGVNPAYWTNMVFTPLVPGGAFVIAAADNSADVTAGLALVGLGAVAVATDFATGAVHKHRPDHVDVVLKPRG